MINFLFKGLLRDRSRSLFPIIIITVIVAIIIFFNGFLKGLYNAMFLNTALVSSGHVKVVTSAYHKESQLLPNDLALLEVNILIEDLESQHNTYFWTPRITFAGLLDVPDKNGETLTQSPVFALGVDFLSDNSRQLEIWNLDKKIIKGELPDAHNEILLSEKLSDRLNVKEGQKITFIGSTMEGAFTTYNYTVSGIFNLRMGPIDNQMMLVDIKGAQFALDMENAASEILGYKNSLVFDDNQTVKMKEKFNINYSDSLDIYSPIMLALRDSNQMGAMIDFTDVIIYIILSIVLFVVTVVLWNLGIMNCLRRYGEIGMRLAIGETKSQVFKTMIFESLMIALIGSIIGTILGVSITSYFQYYGIDYSKGLDALTSSNIAMPNIFYPQVTNQLFYLGFIPGIFATVLGTMLASRVIYKREMAQLFKELEV